MNREELISRLKDLDEEAALLFGPDDRMSMIIVGGGALVLMEYTSRMTHDIDAIHVSHPLDALLESYDINCRVQTFINNFPYNFEDRIKHLPIEGKIIDFYTASLEDIVIAKLFSDRSQDREDVMNPNIVRQLNWDLLNQLARGEEVRNNALNHRCYLDFMYNFEEYERRYRPCKE